MNPLSPHAVLTQLGVKVYRSALAMFSPGFKFAIGAGLHFGFLQAFLIHLQSYMDGVYCNISLVI